MLRINSSSKRVIAQTRKYLEKTTGGEFDYAVSSRNHLMLDFDCSGEKRICVNDVFMTLELISEEFEINFAVYETPNGFHAIALNEKSWREISKVLKAILVGIRNGVFPYLDSNHIEACIRRGYMTLRLNQIRKIGEVINGKTAYNIYGA